MKRVLLLGDSIRMGYDSMVKELLSDKYEVLFPEDNGRFSSYTLWQMNQYFKNEGSFDLVHWNNGYWDMNPERPMNEPRMQNRYLPQQLRFIKWAVQKITPE